MRRSLARDFAAVPGVEVAMTIDRRLPPEPGPWTVIAVGPGEEAGILDDWSALVDHIVLIAPETGGLLLGHARRLGPSGRAWLGTPESIALAGDKLRLGEHWVRSGIPTPESRRVSPREGMPADAHYPAILKPIDGAGCVETFALAGPGGLPEGAKGLEAAILQPDLPGEPLSASFLIAGGEAVLLAQGRQQVVREEGRLSYRGGEAPIPPVAAERELLAALACVEGLRGWVGVDFLWHPGEARATIVEINPRMTTSFVGLSRAAGLGRIASAWLALEGGDPEPARELARGLRGSPPVSFRADGGILDR